MATARQSQAAKRNMQTAQQERWRKVVGCAGAARSRGRVKPGSRAAGLFFRIELTPTRRFATFRYHDVGKKVASSASPVNAQMAHTSELQDAGEQTTAASISDQRQGERRVK
jgi:hypothetical protein